MKVRITDNSKSQTLVKGSKLTDGIWEDKSCKHTFWVKAGQFVVEFCSTYTSGNIFHYSWSEWLNSGNAEATDFYLSERTITLGN